MCAACGLNLKVAADADPHIWKVLHDNLLHSQPTLVFAADADFAGIAGYVSETCIAQQHRDNPSAPFPPSSPPPPPPLVPCWSTLHSSAGQAR